MGNSSRRNIQRPRSDRADRTARRNLPSSVTRRPTRTRILRLRRNRATSNASTRCVTSYRCTMDSSLPMRAINVVCQVRNVNEITRSRRVLRQRRIRNNNGIIRCHARRSNDRTVRPCVEILLTNSRPTKRIVRNAYLLRRTRNRGRSRRRRGRLGRAMLRRSENAALRRHVRIRRLTVRSLIRGPRCTRRTRNTRRQTRLNSIVRNESGPRATSSRRRRRRSLPLIRTNIVTARERRGPLYLGSFKRRALRRRN